jgi:DNA-binding transcriptional LysR family regulator
MELRHLRYFVAVAEELHFGRAAKRLHIAQPPLSQQIQALERELGVRLLDRTRRRVELTEAGKVFLTEATRTLTQAARAVDAAQRAARGEMGQLAVGFVTTVTYELLPPILRTFRRRFPTVRLVLREMSTPDQVRAVLDGELHVGLVRPPVRDEELVMTTLRREPVSVALPQAHALAALDEVPMPALAREPLILYPTHSRPSWADYMLELCRKAHFEPSVVQETLETQAALSLVAAGIGYTLIPSSARLLRLPGIAVRPIAPPTPVTKLLAIHRRDVSLPTLAAFLRLARAANHR